MTHHFALEASMVKESDFSPKPRTAEPLPRVLDRFWAIIMNGCNSPSNRRNYKTRAHASNIKEIHRNDTIV